jgi:hypothetical protein
MSKVDEYRVILRTLEDWDAYLIKESRLPGPRANLELAYAVAEEGEAAQFARWLTEDRTARAPTNTPEEFVVCCGVLGLGKMLVQGNSQALAQLREYASDARWRVREMVAMALQRYGRHDMDALLEAMTVWRLGNCFEQRAVAAALCEPELLGDPEHAASVLRILDRITESMQTHKDRKSNGFIALRKGLGYCWSVAVAASPRVGKPMMERWFFVEDKDIRWVMKQNLKKKRLERADAAWVSAWRESLG